MRIAILGYSGSGKSTLAHYLSERLAIPVLFLDTVQFTAGWQERDRDEAKAMVTSFMEKESWIIDGNYTNFFQKERLRAADRIILLLFPPLTCFHRAFHRYRSYKGETRESMAAGCDEKFELTFAWWVLHKGRTAPKRAHNEAIIKQYPEKTLVLRNQKQLSAFMASPFCCKTDHEQVQLGHDQTTNH